MTSLRRAFSLLKYSGGPAREVTEIVKVDGSDLMPAASCSALARLHLVPNEIGAGHARRLKR